MTAEDHIVAYIESDSTYYARLLELYRRRQPNCRDGFIHPTGVVCAALNIVTDCYSYMICNGDASRDDMYSPTDLARTAAALCEWEAPE